MPNLRKKFVLLVEYAYTHCSGSIFVSDKKRQLASLLQQVLSEENIHDRLIQHFIELLCVAFRHQKVGFGMAHGIECIAQER